jgi:copper homeostasis protein CutC
MADPTYSPKVYRKLGGDEMVVASGGTITVESGGSITVGGVTIDENTTAVTGLTASAAELNESFLHLDIADGSAEATYYMVAPHAGDITKIYTVIDGVVSTADITITAKIGSTGITNGVVTIATAASAAGDVDVATPTAANTVTAGQAINFVVTGGGAGGSPRIHLVAVLTR